MKKPLPYLWFDDAAEAAVDFYVRTIPDSRIEDVHRYGDAGADVSGQPSGSVMSVSFTLGGVGMVALNGGPLYRFSPAVSFFVNCATADEVDRIFGALAEGGEVLMPLDAYPFSERYGWLADRYGVNWQVMRSDAAQRVVPSLLFVGARFRQAAAAIDRYLSVLPDSAELARERAEDGSVLFSAQRLGGLEFRIMESGEAHAFDFTPAVSFLLACETDEEHDRLYAALSDGGEIQPCGWLADRFGISWQVVPEGLFAALQDEDPVRAERAMAAMLTMTKIDLGAIERAKDGPVEIEALVRATPARVWECWTEPRHIVRWNAASDDWHTPRAENDLQPGGTFVSRMEAKDGSAGFDFGGVYDEVVPERVIAYTLGDGRKVRATFEPRDGGTATFVRETFDAEGVHPREVQRQGWQSILDRFKAYAEAGA